MNKLAILAFALLSFFSFMLWYLANGSLNDYLKSQVLLQSHYYTQQQASLTSASFSTETGVAQASNFSLNNSSDLSQPLVLSIGKIQAQLAKSPTSQLSGPSVQKKTTTVIHVESILLSNVNIWIEEDSIGNSNLDLIIKRISKQLAIDYPALYPEISARLYAEKHPELNVKKVKQTNSTEEQSNENNIAIQASKAAKQEKRLLGKATTRIEIKALLLDDLSITTIKDGKSFTKVYKHIALGNIGDERGLASNQIGGEAILKLLNKALSY